MKRKVVTSADGVKVYCAFTKLSNPKRLKPHPENTHLHPDSQIKLLGEIIEANGWRETITVSKRSGVITRGHARVAAAIAKGWKEVPVEIQNYGSDEEELADLIADTRIKEFSNLNDDKLRALIVSMKESGADLKRTGLSDAMIEQSLRDYQRSLEIAMLQPSAGEQGTIRQVILIYNAAQLDTFKQALAKVEKTRQFGSLSELVLELLKENEAANAAPETN